MTIPACLEDKKTHLHSQLAGLTPSDLCTVKPFIPILNHYYEVLLVPISTFHYVLVLFQMSYRITVCTANPP